MPATLDHSTVPVKPMPSATELNLDRFWTKVRKAAGCWEWLASKNHKGYGQFAYRRTNFYAHRVSWLLHFGDPGGLLVLHHCDNPGCVNPEHLYIGTHQDNSNDCMRRGRVYRPRGEKGTKAKLTNEDVAMIRSIMPKTRTDRTELAGRLGVSWYTIGEIVRGETWKGEH